jgi:hypothetical protein
MPEMGPVTLPATAGSFERNMTAHPRLLGACSAIAGAPTCLCAGCRDQRLSAVVPCYNEAEGIQELVDRLANACEEYVGDDYDLILINDGSSDSAQLTLDRRITPYSER